MPEEVSLFEYLWNYFVDLFIYPENIVFDNLNLSLDTMIAVRNILVGLFVGVIVASLSMMHTKRVLGNFVRKLLSDEILSEDAAVRLAETGYVTNFSIRNALKHGNTLRCVVRCREEEEHKRKMAEAELEYEEKRKSEPNLPPFVPTVYKVDVDADHFYIDDQKKYQAEMRFDKKGTNWVIFAGVIILLILLFCGLMLLIPEILELIDSIAGVFNGVPNNILT